MEHQAGRPSGVRSSTGVKLEVDLEEEFIMIILIILIATSERLLARMEALTLCLLPMRTLLYTEVITNQRKPQWQQLIPR